MKLILSFLAFLAISFAGMAFGQSTAPYNGVEDRDLGHYILTNAHIVAAPNQEYRNAALEIKNGKILKIHAINKTPKGAVVIDLKGFRIYPGFIDAYSDYGIKVNPPPSPEGALPPQMERKTNGNLHWNESIHPETKAALLFAHDEDAQKSYLSSGFTTVNTHYEDGLARGTSVVVNLGKGTPNQTVIKNEGAAHFSISRKGSSKMTYPSSLMGNIALLRQLWYDSEWYSRVENPSEKNISFEAYWKQINEMPVIIEAMSHQNVLRAAQFKKEFDFPVTALGKGDSYKRAKEIAAAGIRVIVPLAFPKGIDLQDPYDGLLVPMSELKEWELAPYNARILLDAGVPICFTSHLNKKKDEFLTNLRKSVQCGLPKDEALRALTESPAKLLGIDQQAGTIESGKLANLVITNGDLFDPKTHIMETWVQGERHSFEPLSQLDIRGTFTLNVGGHIRKLEVKGTKDKPKATVIIRDSVKVPALIEAEQKKITLAYSEKDSIYSGIVRLSGVMHLDAGAWDGQGQWSDGKWITWNAIRKDKFAEKPEKKDSTAPLFDTILPPLSYPLMAYGFDSLPKPRTILIKNATLWTNASTGILHGQSILLQDGKIKAIGQILDVGDQNTWVIDAEGKHVTPGIIDEHSHIANSGGVNESGQHISAEVRLGDVVDADDINIYRQLAGGVTTSQILHGSANPIGGQSALIKLKWGRSANEMLVANAPPFIKFALGENVKQSNWGDMNTIRFPQTRMGVEQVYYDAFTRARAYKQEWESFDQEKNKRRGNAVQPRRDLELEALAQILNGERFVTCHSYVQSEIVMLMRVADSMGFTLNTFTHILEGYKVADKMKAHGAGGSSFSDWWAYKYEVKDAIPHNASVLNKMGVITALNSDDAEMARRLNQEAAKAIKYGRTSEEDALKMVTLNPAKLLHIDHRVGSLEIGKDADVVLWSGHPLSIYSKAEKTIIEGVVYFDAERDAAMRLRDAREKTRLVSKMIEAKEKGEPMRPLFPDQKAYFKCSDY